MPSLSANLSRKSSVSEKSSLVAAGLVDEEKQYGATKERRSKLQRQTTETKTTEEDSKKRTRLPVFSLYRYSNAFDLLLIVVGTVSAIVTGAGLPVISILFGSMTNSFLAAQTSPLNKDWDPPPNYIQNGSRWTALINGSTIPIPMITAAKFESDVIQFSVYYCYVGLAVFVSSYLMTSCWATVCERQMHRIRKEFFYAILRQNQAWFDEHQSGELTSRLSDDLDRIKEGIGDKMGILFQSIATFLAGYVVAFTKNWKLSLVMLAVMPIIVFFGSIFSNYVSKASRVEQQKYAVAGGIAEEVISCVRTVISFNGQQKEVARYGSALENGKKQGIRKQLFTALNLGIIMLVVFASYALAFWYGAVLIRDGDIERGSVFTVFMCVLFGSFALTAAAPQAGVLAVSQGAAAAIFDIIDERPDIDPYSRKGAKPTGCKGFIEFKHVKFSYPSRKDVPIFQDLSFEVQPGDKIALVGPSGCGKSTVVNLLLRFYDPGSGKILLDGNELKSLNLNWLRNVVGVVSQEPILFDATIAENIRYGKPDVTEREMIDACKNANAHEFIKTLPKGYQTMVGERGTQLSGGQKQRIAIARSLVRNPKILLLDEATSALDAESEGIVQEALDKAQQGRTTIIVAHRLSTIRNANKIIALQDGNIKEIGTHEELMEKKGVYYDLIMAQTFEDTGYVTGETSETNPDEENDIVGPTPDLKRAISRQESKGSRLRKRSSRMSENSYSIDTPSSKGDRKMSGKRKLTRMLSKGPKSDEKERLKEELKEEGIDKSNLTKILEEAKSEWVWILLGLVGGAIRGAVMPAFAFVYSEIFSVYTRTGDALVQGAAVRALWFVLIGVLQFIGTVSAIYYLAIAGENLTMRLRLRVFENILRMDGAYFDEPRHNTGKLCTRLSTDAPAIKTAFDFRFASVLSSIISMLAGIIIGFIYGWQMALLVIAALPVLGLSSYINLKLRHGSALKDTQLLEDAGKTASEGIENVKTVQYLTRELTFYDMFCVHLVRPHKTNMRTCHIHGLGYGFAQASIYFLYAASFRFGGWLVLQHLMEPTNVFRVFNSVVFAGMTVGFATAYFGEYAKARLCGALIFNMLREKPKIDSYSKGGLKPNVQGSIKFTDVFFRYPTRPDTEVFKGFDINIQPGQTLALVGQSGCGKSTAVSLLERFYDPWAGTVMMDEFNLKTINVKHLRDQISIVSQEPVLFDSSIRDNIAYGISGGITQEKIVQAAQAANIHDFILSLPEGYNTKVGEKGTQLSGGQKQRVAIARALIREPKILLLDEATSALDTESEKIVQEALDRARKGRTSIIIAHRLSTVQNADIIAVIKGGKIVETGTHQELISMRGVYYELTKRQNLDAH